MDAFTKTIENGMLTVTHASGHIDNYDQGHYDQLIEMTETDMIDLNAELLSLKIERQQIIDSQGG